MYVNLYIFISIILLCGLLNPNYDEQNGIHILFMFTDKHHIMHSTFPYHSSVLYFLNV